MFKSREDGTAIIEGGGENMNTIIGKDTTFSGTLEVAGTLRVDGVIKGEVNVTDTIAIGPSGKVEANVKTKNAVISGALKGNIHASDRIELQAKANIMGDLVTKSLVIEQGAIFHGNCKMNVVEHASAPQPPRREGLALNTPSKAPAQTAEKTR